MARAKVKITPVGRRIQSSKSQRSGGLKKGKVPGLDGRDQDSGNRSPSLDYNVIEEIANGVEKMILSWSHVDGGEQEQKARALEDAREPATFAIWTGNKLKCVGPVSPHNSRLSKKEVSVSGFCEESKDISGFSFYKHLKQEQPDEAVATAEIAAGMEARNVCLDNSNSEGGMGHGVTKVVTETHSGQVTTDDSRAEFKTSTKSAAYWITEGRNISPAEIQCDSVCTERTSCSTVAESPLQSLHQQWSLELADKLHSRGKDVSIVRQPSNVHSTPGTPPISERSVKRMQSQEDSVNEKPQLSMSKKTRWSEKVTSAPINNGACYSEDEECLKSPRSDCSLLDLTSNSSWNDPLVGSPCRTSDPLLIDATQGLCGDFGPWESVAGHDAPAIVSRVSTRPDSDMKNCTKEKTSFVSFKLWKASKQSESGHEGNVEAESNAGKPRPLDTDNIVPEPLQGSTSGRERQDCGVAAQAMIGPPTSDSPVNGDRSAGGMEELQIALLECATEYEIKTIEMKMKLKHIKNLNGDHLFLDSQSTPSDVSDVNAAGARKPTAMISADQLREDEVQQMEKVKRHVYKLQHQKVCLAKELADLKKKERQFELQKKSLDAALHKLDRLEWEKKKKEQELEECQLRQRHAVAQLQDSAMELQRLTNYGDLAGPSLDSASLLSLLPTLRGFVQSLAQKDTRGFSSDDQSQQGEGLCDSTEVDEIVGNLMHEVQGLQHELNGMLYVAQDSKLKKITQRQTSVTSRDHCGRRPSTRASPRPPRDQFPHGKL